MDREREFVRHLSEFLALHTEVSGHYLTSLIAAFMKGARGSRDFPPPEDELGRKLDADISGGVPNFVQNYLRKSLDKHQWPPQAAFVAGRYLRRPSDQRFMSWPQRQKMIKDLEGDTVPGSELGFRQTLYSQGVNSVFRWRGVPCFKPNYDISLYAMLLDELKPATIVELGAGTGGSALFFADLCAALGFATNVISIDRTATTVTDPRITFHRMDCFEWLTAQAQAGRTLQRPCLLIEDFHGDLNRCFGHMDSLLDTGDYLIIEDSLDKQEQIAKVIAGRPYVVDSKYTDFFGINCTTSMNSIFKKATLGETVTS